MHLTTYKIDYLQFHLLVLYEKFNSIHSPPTINQVGIFFLNNSLKLFLREHGRKTEGSENLNAINLKKTVVQNESF